jgi:cathepsin A (carboxypeptidase C)
MGGHVTNYEDNLTFATVHGSGHMIPQFRPRVSLHVFKKFIAGELLSPLLPSDEELEKFDDYDDDDGENNGALIDNWTTEAESYV